MKETSGWTMCGTTVSLDVALWRHHCSGGTPAHFWLPGRLSNVHIHLSAPNLAFLLLCSGHCAEPQFVSRQQSVLQCNSAQCESFAALSSLLFLHLPIYPIQSVLRTHKCGATELWLLSLLQWDGNWPSLSVTKLVHWHCDIKAPYAPYET